MSEKNADLEKIIQNAKTITDKMKLANDKLEKEIVEGVSRLFTVRMNGNQKLLEVKINAQPFQALIKEGNVEDSIATLEESFKVALQDVLLKTSEFAKQELNLLMVDMQDPVEKLPLDDK